MDFTNSAKNTEYQGYFLTDVNFGKTDTAVLAKGIDVSSEQGEFNWTPWENKLSFSMIRATSWTTENKFGMDEQFERNWDSMWNINGAGKLVRFAYHYARPGMTTAVQQAAGFVGAVMSCGLATGDHFVLDLEENDDEPPAYVAEWSVQFCQEVNRLCPGHRCLIYCSQGFADSALDLTHDIQRWYLWVANYGVETPAVPLQWAKTGWKFWQWTGTDLDQNYFNGTEEELLTFARMPENRL